jgi:P27 family predicted phage terminase small subunit
MARKGPVPTPPHLRALREGEASPEPRVPPVGPEEGHGRSRFKPPEWLSVDAKRAFGRLVVDIDAAWPGTLARMDVMALAVLAEHYAVLQAAAREMRSGGNRAELTSPDPQHADRTRKNPAWQVFREASSAFVALSKEYGLTLSSRLRMELDAGAPLADDEEDDLDEVVG